MEFIKQWTFCVCVSLIIAVIFSILTPKGSMKTFYKMMLSVFVFISFVIPFGDFSVSDFDFETADLADVLQTDENKNVETMINSEVTALLKSKGVSGFAVASDASYNPQNGEINVQDIQVSVSDDEDLKYIESLVFDNLGLKVRVINVGS